MRKSCTVWHYFWFADVQSKNNLPTFKLQADGATRVGSVAPMLLKLTISKKALILHRELIGQADKRTSGGRFSRAIQVREGWPL